MATCSCSRPTPPSPSFCGTRAWWRTPKLAKLPGEVQVGRVCFAPDSVAYALHWAWWRMPKPAKWPGEQVFQLLFWSCHQHPFAFSLPLACCAHLGLRGGLVSATSCQLHSLG